MALNILSTIIVVILLIIVTITMGHGKALIDLFRLQFFCLHTIREAKGKGKGRFSWFIRHCGFVKTIVPSPLGLPYFITRGAVYQSDTRRTLLAKEGTNGIWPAISEFSKRAGFFNMPHSWDMGQILLLLLRRKAFCRFFRPEKSDGLGRE
jgi:hypothetical protein